MSIKANAQIPFFGGGEVTTEVSFSATQGWSDTTTTTKSMEQTISATTGVQPRTSVVLTLMILDTKSDIAYTGTAEVAFNVTLSGFLQWGGNARDDHPKDRPQVKYRFGTIGGKTPSSHVPGGTTGQNGDDNLSALEHIAAMYNNRAIPKYSIWDWAWVEQKAPGYMKFFAQTPNEGCTNPIGVHLAGKFSDVAGTQAYIDTSDATPLPPQTDSDSDTDSGVDGWANDAEHDPPNSPQEHSAPTFVVLR